MFNRDIIVLHDIGYLTILISNIKCETLAQDDDSLTYRKLLRPWVVPVAGVPSMKLHGNK